MIGLKSDELTGLVIFGIGVIKALFQISENVEEVIGYIGQTRQQLASSMRTKRGEIPSIQDTLDIYHDCSINNLWRNINKIKFRY